MKFPILARKSIRKINNFPIAKKTFNEYCKTTSIHGIHFIADTQRSMFERIFWLIAFIASVTMCGILIKNVMHKSEPVIVTFAERSLPIFYIPYPAFTICPQNRMDMGNTNATYLHDYDNKDDLRGQVCPTTIYSYLLEKEKYKKIISYNIESMTRELKSNLEDALLICGSTDDWRNNYEPTCFDYFRESFTANGLCYTTNGLGLSDLLRDDVVKMGKEYLKPTLTWSLDNGYGDPLRFDRNYPYNNFGGIISDSVILLLNQTDTVGKPICDYFNGFKLFLHSPSDIPMYHDEFIKLSCGDDMRLALIPNYVTTSHALKEYLPMKRGCFYSYERYLKYFKVYTEKNCWMECLTNFTLNTCGCVFFYMPRYNTTPICGMGSVSCYSDALEKVRIEVIDRSEKRKTPEILNCNCMPTCNSITYEADIANSMLTFNETFRNNITLTKSMVLITAFLKSAEFIPITRSELFSITDLIANCGGILGLFMGFSLLSLAEIVYYCTIRPFIIYLSEWRWKKNIVCNSNMLQTDNWNQIKFVKATLQNDKFEVYLNKRCK